METETKTEKKIDAISELEIMLKGQIFQKLYDHSKPLILFNDKKEYKVITTVIAAGFARLNLRDSENYKKFSEKSNEFLDKVNQLAKDMELEKLAGLSTDEIEKEEEVKK